MGAEDPVLPREVVWQHDAAQGRLSHQPVAPANHQSVVTSADKPASQQPQADTG